MPRKYNKQLFRMATYLYAKYRKKRPPTSDTKLPEDFGHTQKLWRLFQLTQQRQLHRIAAKLAAKLRLSVRHLYGRLTLLDSELERIKLEQPKVSLREIYQDLVALQDEFPKVEMDLRPKLIKVTTEPIDLEGVHLGAYKIVLHCRELGQPNCTYDVIAVDDFAAASNSGVTHPHVQDERLCEGDGYHAIRKALADGRLLDFFQIVDQVLHSYNAESAYVTLDDWSGKSCQDCGYLTPEHRISTCDDCDAGICDDCICSCGRCDATLCNDYGGTCPGCDVTVCNDCLTRCSVCSEKYCRDCLNEKGHCEPCQKNDEDDDQTDTETDVQPDGLGEAAVPA